MRHAHIARVVRFTASAVVFTLLIAGCATTDLFDERTRWRIVDAPTKAGVPGAAVLVTYGGTAWAPGHSTTTCSRAYFAFTDINGWIDLPGMGTKAYGTFFVYKRGQVTAIPMLNGKLNEIYLRPARDDSQERLTNLHYLRASASCNHIGRNGKPIVDFLTFVTSEESSASRSSEEIEILNHMRYSRDRLNSAAQGKG